MHLHLGFYFKQRYHVGNFIHIQLTGQYHPRSPFAPPVIGGKIIRRSHLGVPVQLHARRLGLHRRQYRRITEFDAVNADFGNCFYIGRQLVQQPVGHQSAQSGVYFTAHAMGQFYYSCCILKREMTGQPQAKTVVANQQRVGTGIQQRARLFQGCCCCQQFRFVYHVAPSCTCGKSNRITLF
ncbi:hypothetical protein D3C73_1177360 [compost metagenome]